MTSRPLSEGKRPRSDANRALILRHPDLEQQLRDLLGMAKSIPTTAWSGYVPPEVDEHRRLNRSRYRAGIVALLEEARRREAGGVKEGGGI